jgi:hypothetical protein
MASGAIAQAGREGRVPSPTLVASLPSLRVTEVLLSSLPDSVRVKMLAAIARGDIAGAISMWQLATGRTTVPPALSALGSAFSLANRVAGPCVQIAKNISEGFKFLGGNPQFIRISSTQGQFLSWQGRTLMSDNNYHVAVMMEDKIYDAFTGPAGMAQAEYLKNLVIRGAPSIQQVTEEALTP